MTEMLVKLAGYRLTEQIYEGFTTLVLRGIRLSDRQPVVIKLLKSEYPTLAELVRFRNQYAIAKNLNLSGVVKPLALENYRNGLALVMEDEALVSLKDWKWGTGNWGFETEEQESTSHLAPRSHSLNEFIHIAIQIARTLEGLYTYCVIHKDIKPQNILINPETGEVKLIDFGIASLLSRETQEIKSANILEGTLAYMSPEQTGRMNRGLDYRTDFYSLGVTFYELLTGQLPFQSNDPMELIHCHIAKIPTPAIEVNPTIPQTVNDIIMKLMAKTAEERYQSAFGLRYDLELCWQQYSQNGKIEQFPIGEKDICDRFVIPEKLYGREREVETLLAAFDRVSGKGEGDRGIGEAGGAGGAGGEHLVETRFIASESQFQSEMILVGGSSGVGKTAVVNEIHKPIVQRRGYFVKGKFDQFKRNIPLSAWVQAFQKLMRQLLAESADSLVKWKTDILQALGDKGQVIIDVIPELELLIGKQSSVPELEGGAAQNRFNLLFQKFIRVFTTEEHPLVIFLDDLQWADSASLKLIQLLMSQIESRYLLLIGAYRNNEVFPAHPLMLMLDEVRKAKIVNQIILSPLDQSSLNCLIADTLSCSSEQAVPLTELVLQKTQGNPFFISQFLKSLHEDKLIFFNPPQSPLDKGGITPHSTFSKGGWQCDIGKIRAIALTDDVVKFMALQLQKLPVNTQTVLKLAACIGNQFDLASLAIVHEKSQAETAADLWKALQEGLIVPTSEVYKFFQEDDNERKSSQLPVSNYQLPNYKFLHDRVQQAAYSLIPEENKRSTHLQIGQLLLNNTPEAAREEKVFEIVNQLNYGVELIGDRTQRNELARLNLIAGRKAKAATAYSAAVEYLKVGRKLLSADSWHQYNLTLALYEEAAEAAYLSGNFEEMERFSQSVLQQAKTLLDTVKVYEIRMQAYAVQNQLLKAVKTGLSVLQLLGINIPSPTDSDIQMELEEFRENLSEKRIEDLIDLPEMKDPIYLAAMKILSRITAAVYLAAPEMYSLIVYKQVNLSLRYGNTSTSAYAYSSYGLTLCGVLDDIDTGYQFGKLALSLLERYTAKEFQSRTILVVNVFIIHWKQHIKEILQPLRSAYSSSLEAGDLETAGYCAGSYCYHSYFASKELEELEREMTIYSEALSQINLETSLCHIKPYRQAVANLMSRSENPCNLIGEFCNEQELLPFLMQANDIIGMFYLHFNKVILCYLFQDFHQAAENAEFAKNYAARVMSSIVFPVSRFYDSLVQLALYKEASSYQQTRILEDIAVNQKAIQKRAHHAPMNYLHKFYLVEAERHRVLGENTEAMEMYDRAISLAKEHEFINEEALANELAAKFYLAWGKEKIAQTYLIDAYYAYARWGASAKVEDLEKRYPQLLVSILTGENAFLNANQTLSTLSMGTVTSTNVGVSEVLDLATVIKASQTLSGKIELDKLLATLMQLAIANAGASRAVLILQQSGTWIIAATVTAEEPATVLQSIPVAESQEIPKTPINYVENTCETLVLDDVTAKTIFAADPYIQLHKPKSVLCVPLVNQGKLIAILYLENRLTTEAFTSDRIEILKLLCSQAAISLENAQLYNNLEAAKQQLEEYSHTLEERVEQRTAELKAAQKQIVAREKLASLGALTAGVAHELRNPLNFINNFAVDSEELLQELAQELESQSENIAEEKFDNIKELLNDLEENSKTIERQGKRAEGIIQSMLLHARTESGDRQPTDLNDLLAQAVQLAYHSRRAKDSNFNVTISTEYDAAIGQLELFSSDISRAFINLIDNACYAASSKQKNSEEPFTPMLWVKTLHKGNSAEIRIRDNGYGIRSEIRDNIFNPFFTTKPPGEGTGLGLSLTHDIIVGKHQGTIEVESELGDFTEFIITLPLD